jgi:hypothetical protein
VDRREDAVTGVSPRFVGNVDMIELLDEIEEHVSSNNIFLDGLFLGDPK